MITGAAYTEQECETSEAGSWMVVNESRDETGWILPIGWRMRAFVRLEITVVFRLSELYSESAYACRTWVRSRT